MGFVTDGIEENPREKAVLEFWSEVGQVSDEEQVGEDLLRF